VRCWCAAVAVNSVPCLHTPNPCNVPKACILYFAEEGHSPHAEAELPEHRFNGGGGAVGDPADSAVRSTSRADAPKRPARKHPADTTVVLRKHFGDGRRGRDTSPFSGSRTAAAGGADAGATAPAPTRDRRSRRVSFPCVNPLNESLYAGLFTLSHLHGACVVLCEASTTVLLGCRTHLGLAFACGYGCGYHLTTAPKSDSYSKAKPAGLL
jgi:hypothetical protein